MSEQPFSLDLLYQTIEQHLQEKLSGVQLVRFWPDIEQHIPLPAVFLDIAEIEPGTDIGTGESTLNVTFEARVIVDVIRDQHYQQAIHLVTQLAVLLRTQTWGLAVEPAQFQRSTQDWTRPELDGYTVWLVEWTQTIYLGEEEWPWTDEKPGSLVFSVGDEVDP